MPQCCRCNGKSTCANCVCKKSGRKCSGCQPSRRDRCQNGYNAISSITAEKLNVSAGSTQPVQSNQLDSSRSLISSIHRDISNHQVSSGQQDIASQTNLSAISSCSTSYTNPASSHNQQNMPTSSNVMNTSEAEDKPHYHHMLKPKKQISDGEILTVKKRLRQ